MKSYNSGPKHPNFRHSEEKEKKSTLLTLVMLWLDSSQSVLADKQDLLDDNPAKRCEIPFPVFSVCQLQKKISTLKHQQTRVSSKMVILSMAIFLNSRK